MSEEENITEEDQESASVKPTEEVSSKQTNEETSKPSTDKIEETAADLLGANIEQVKVRKAKGSKNIQQELLYRSNI